MSDTIRNENDPILDHRETHVSPDAVEGAHDADGTMGRVAGTGSGAIAGGLIGAAAGPVGAAVGAIAGALIGAGAGNAAHKIGDDQDDVNVETGSGGDLGKNAGAGAGSISGAVIGGVTGGPVGAVAGAVAGGMLGAAAGNAAKDMGGDADDPNVVPASYAGGTTGVASTGGIPASIINNDLDAPTAGVGTTAPTGGLPASILNNNLDAPGMTESAAPVSTPPVANVAPVAPVASTTQTDDTVRVQLAEEQLRVSKDVQSAGEVEVSKHIVEEQVQVPVTLQHEEVVITRHAVDQPATPGTVLGESETIRVPVMQEVAHVTKEAHIAEEIEIQKRSVSEQQVVGDTVRREEVVINNPTQTTSTTTTGGISTGASATGADLTPGNNVPGVQTGGTNADGSPDTRGLTEKAADTLTGDHTDDKTGRRI